MNLSLFELLAAKNDELDAQRQRIEAQRDLRLARNTVQQLFAGGLPEATSTPMMSADPPGATTGDAH
jgi:outer membrane protein TolC